MNINRIFYHTKSICAECRHAVNASVVEADNKVYLEKLCPKHGISYTLVSSNSEWFKNSLRYIKPKTTPLSISNPAFKGCPESCGLCPAHQQHTCLPIIEITSDCDLSCPICLKIFSQTVTMTSAEFERIIDKLLITEKKPVIINLSGGEPLLHPDLHEFIKIASEKGIMQTSVSTNGLAFLTNPGLIDLFKQTGTIAALQFDGFLPETYTALRGADLSNKKLRIIELFEKEEIPYSLVATIASGINEREIPSITNFFFASKALSLMFQPAAYTGSATTILHDKLQNVTIPDVIEFIDKSVYAQRSDFNPLPCSHYACFALAYYFQTDEKSFRSLKELLGLTDYLEIIANRTLPGLDYNGFNVLQSKIYSLWAASDSLTPSDTILNRIRSILQEFNSNGFDSKKAFQVGTTYMKAIFIHQFMDHDSFDVGRLMKCCNHYVRPDGTFMPMCGNNILFQ